MTWGTGMIASSSTFCYHSGRVIRDLFCMLNVVKHCTEALVYSNHPREAAAFSYLAIIFGRIASDVLWVQNPLSGEQQETLSITHHALSPHPHIIICSSFISSTDYNVVIVLQCQIKDHLCRKMT